MERELRQRIREFQIYKKGKREMSLEGSGHNEELDEDAEHAASEQKRQPFCWYYVMRKNLRGGGGESQEKGEG